LVSDFKQRVRIPSKKKTISQINSALRITMWACLGISGALITLCAIAYVSNSEVFRIKKIDITGNAQIKRDEVLTLLDIEQGDNILSWNMNMARKRLQKHPWIKDLTISRSFVPTSVKVCITEHKPEATLFLKDRPYLISEEGLVFASSSGTYYGLLINASDYTRQDMDQVLGQTLKNAMSAATLVQSKGLDVRDLAIEPGGLVDIRLKNGITLTIFGEMTPIKVEMVKKTLTELKPPEGTIMDLRCDDKVVLRNRGIHGSQG
jgi:cell division septal protein FtsQ